MFLYTPTNSDVSKGGLGKLQKSKVEGHLFIGLMVIGLVAIEDLSARLTLIGEPTKELLNCKFNGGGKGRDGQYHL